MRPGALPAALLLSLLALAAPAAAQLPLGAVGLYEYHTYATLEADLRALAEAHPDLARLTSIGQSTQGLELWNLEVGNLSSPGYDERPAFYLDGGHHGNEALGIEAPYLFAKELLEGYGQDPAITEALDTRRIYITPLINPDGKTANTRQNGALVNLNRNYPLHWNERGTDPAPPGGNYAGPSEGSEPETQANMAFIEAVRPGVYVSLHTGSYDMVRPFGYAPDEPVPDEELYQHLFAWAEAETGLTNRYPGGSGESICWAYGARGIFSILLEVYALDVRPGGTPQLFFGPATEADVRAVLEPHLQVMRHLLAESPRWGALLEARLVDVRGAEATLEVVNLGMAPARAIAPASTGLQLLGELPATLAPGASARVPVRFDGPSQVLLSYQRLAVPTEDPAATLALAQAELLLRPAAAENVAVPGPEPLLLLAALAGAALVARRVRG